MLIKPTLLISDGMTLADLSINFRLIALDYVYGDRRRSPLSSQPNRIVLLCIGLHLLLTTFLASHLSLWFDEAYSLATTNNDLPTTLQWAINFEEQAPLYFILLWFTRHIHDSIFIARLPSILATAGTLWLSSCISRQLFPRIHQGWIVLALAFNPYLIRIALEVRGYAWAVFLSTLLLWLFIEGYVNCLLDPAPSSLVARPLIPQQNQPWARWAYTIAAIIGIYSHYFLSFQIAAQGIVLFLIALCSVERRKRAIANLSDYCLNGVIITLFTLPLIGVVSQQISSLENNSPIIHNPTPSKIFKAAVGKSFISNLVFLLPSDPTKKAQSAWKFIRLLLGLWLLALAWGRRRHLRFNVTLVWLIHSLVMLQLMGALLLVHSVEYRHSILLIGLVYLSTLGLISLLPRRRRRLLLSLSLSLLLCLHVSSLWQIYTPMAKHGDYARVGDYLKQVVKPQQPVVVFNNEVAMTLTHYYPGEGNSNSALIPLPQPLFNGNSIPQYRQDNLSLTSSEQIKQALMSAMPQERQPLTEKGLSATVRDESIDNRPISQVAEQSELPQSLWLVQDNHLLTETPIFDESYSILKHFMTQNYRLLTMRQFYGTQVQQWQRLPAEFDSGTES